MKHREVLNRKVQGLSAKEVLMTLPQQVEPLEGLGEKYASTTKGQGAGKGRLYIIWLMEVLMRTF